MAWLVDPWARVAATLGTLAVSGALLDCGARSPLDERSLPGDGGGGSASSVGGAGGGGEEPSCMLRLAGAPIEIMAFADRHVLAPSVAVIDPGDPNSGRPALAALQGFASGGDSIEHSDIRLMTMAVSSSPWPGAVAIEHPPELFGIESHGWAEMARAPNGRDEIAMAWYSDPGQVGRTAFRTMHTAIWAANPPVDVSFEGSSALALAPGRATGPFGVGYEGDGYALAWRETFDVGGEAYARTRAVVLDSAGQIVLGPHPQGLEEVYPGRSPVMTWSGETYLIATAFTSCPPDADCQYGGLTIERIRPASGDALDDSGIETVFGLDPGFGVGRPAIDSFEGRTYVSWTEDLGGIRRLRLLELTPMGEVQGGVYSVAEAIANVARPTLVVASFGVVIPYPEDGDVTKLDAEPGRSRIALRHTALDGRVLARPEPIDATLFDDYGPVHAAPIDHPRGVLLTWSGRGLANPHEVAYLALLTCSDEQPCASSADCAADAYCEAACCTEPGVCQPRPGGCPDPECPIVLGCDGQTYCTACEAADAGTDVHEPGCF